MARYDDIIQDVRTEIHAVREEVAAVNGKMTVLIALNLALVLTAIGPHLARLFT